MSKTIGKEAVAQSSFADHSSLITHHSFRNILVIKLRYLGDVLLATPVLRILRETFPGARVSMAVNAGTEDILKRNPDLDEVITVKRDGIGAWLTFLRGLRGRRFDCVIDLTDADRSAVLAWTTGAGTRVGLNEEHRWRGLLYTTIGRHRPESRHRIEKDLDVLRALGIESSAGPPCLEVSAEDEHAAADLLDDFGAGTFSPRRPLVMLQPGARYWFKAWPAERFAALGDRLAQRFDCQVLIGGDRHDRPLAESIRSQLRSKPVVLAGRTSVLQHAAVLKRCALFVGNDNGPMHMASALGVPVLALFGPSDPAEWGPRGGAAEVLYKGLDCRECFHPTCRRGEQSCMRLISVDEVFIAAERLLVRGSKFEAQPYSQANRL
jgi:heptosyltransferase-3